MKKVMFAACILALGLCSCADVKPKQNQAQTQKEKDEQEAASSLITLEKDGSIKSRLVEDFGEDYSEDDLRKLIDASITAYKGKAGSSKIELKNCEKDKNGKLVVDMIFDNSDAYAGWNNYFLEYMYASELGLDDGGIEQSTQGFFAGTVSDAYSAGYSLDFTLNSVSDKGKNDSVSKSDLLGMGENHIVILERHGDEDAVDIKCYDEILYVGDGVNIIGKKSASINTAEGYGVIVFK